MYGYGLFVCDGKTFYSPKLIEVMKPFEDRRARIDAYKRNKENAKSLEINDKTTSSNDIVSFEVKGKGEGKVKGKKEEETSSPISSSSAAAQWEKYINEQQKDEQ